MDAPLAERGHAEGQAQRAVAVIGMEPVVAGFEEHARRDEHCLMTGPANLKKNQALIFELDFLVVQPPRHDHRAVGAKEVFGREALQIDGRSVLFRSSAVADCSALHARGGPFKDADNLVSITEL